MLALILQFFKSIFANVVDAVAAHLARIIAEKTIGLLPSWNHGS